MRELPDCPKCHEPDLKLIRSLDWTAIRCRECGWHHTFHPTLTESELYDAIAAAVRAPGAPASGRATPPQVNS